MEVRKMVGLVTIAAAGCGEPMFYGEWVIDGVESGCEAAEGFGPGDPFVVDASGMWDEDFTVDFQRADDPFDRLHGCSWIDGQIFVCDAPCQDHEDPTACDDVCVRGVKGELCPELSGIWSTTSMSLTLAHPSWEDVDDPGRCPWVAEASPPIVHRPWRPFDMSAIGGMGI